MPDLIDVEHWENVDPQNPPEWPYRYFSPMEMACRGTGRIVISHDFMGRLHRVREALNKPMHITSGCRTMKHNKAIGGKMESFHICDAPLSRDQQGCLAVDVAATEGSYRGELFRLAWDAGFSVGWNAKRGFLHLDRRVDVGWRQTTFDY